MLYTLRPTKSAKVQPSTSVNTESDAPIWAQKLGDSVDTLTRSHKTLCKRIGQLEFANARQRSRIDVLIARLEKHERSAIGRLGLHIPVAAEERRRRSDSEEDDTRERR